MKICVKMRVELSSVMKTWVLERENFQARERKFCEFESGGNDSKNVNFFSVNKTRHVFFYFKWMNK